MKQHHSSSIQLKMLRNFLSRTISAAGFSHVVRTKSQWHRIFWVIILMSATATMILMTYGVLQEYLKYPKAWQSKTVPVNWLEFPAVTVCSRYLIPRINAQEAKLDYMEDMREFLDSVPNRSVPIKIRAKCHSNPLCTWNRFAERCDCNRSPCETTLCYTPRGSSGCICSRRLCLWNPAGCQNIKDNGQDTCVCHLDFDYSPFIRNTTYLNREYNESLLTNASRPVLEFIKLMKSAATSDLNDLDLKLMPEIRIMDDYGISFDGLIISCNYGGMDCDRNDFTTLYSPNYGKCYMFNYIGQQKGRDKPKKKLVTKPGRIHGLQLYLQTRRINMLPLYARRLGARVTIHDSHSLPFSRETGFDLRHRDLHSISIQSQEVNRLGPPFGHCGADGDHETPSTFQEKPYNQINCERRCLNEYVFSRCKCYHRLYMSGTTLPTGIRACRPHEFKCFGEVLEDINANKVKCDCPAPCREDVMGVLVFYQSMSIINITETSIYSWQFLIANIGGNMGLFLGLSIVTFVEVAEFLFDVAEKTFRRRKIAHFCTTFKIHPTLKN